MGLGFESLRAHFKSSAILLGFFGIIRCNSHICFRIICNKMKKTITAIIAALAIGTEAIASDHTLRLDYVFIGGTPTAQPAQTVQPAQTGISIALTRMSATEGWYGRTVNMDRLPVAGDADIKVVDNASGKTVYANSFSTLFQEWLTTDEFKIMVKAFENTLLVPMPDAPATVTIRLFDKHRQTVCEYSHPVNPQDILIARKAESKVDRKYIHKGGDSKKCIDVAIIAEGYTAAEKERFYQDAEQTVEAIFSHEPFGRNRNCFNFLAIAPESFDTGVSVPREKLWRQTPVSSNFDTFYIERYLTTDHVFKIHDILEGLPYEHIIILANTDVYGGGGIYNSYTLTTAHHKYFKPVVVHEFGHSFGALADEYDYDSYGEPYFYPDTEPWEQNVTTKYDFGSKWQDMMEAGVPGVGLQEGAGYQSKGVWRSREDCRMRTNKSKDFCPVCQRAIERMIRFNLLPEAETRNM